MSDYRISLAAARVNAGMTQEDVAKKMHVTKQTVINWEKGRTDLKPAEFQFMINLYGVPKDIVLMPEV